MEITANKKYYLHYKLRKKGNTVLTFKKEVEKRANVLSTIEQKWLEILIGNGYGIRNGMFNE